MVDEFQASVLHRPASQALRFLPEGPYTCGDDVFCWVAIQHGPDATFGSLNTIDTLNNHYRSFELDGRPGFAFPTDQPNTFVVGLERAVKLINVETGASNSVVEGIDDDVDGTIINDGVVFDEGLVFGTKDLEFKEKKAGLYLWRYRDPKLTRLRHDQICSNGKAVYHRDGATRLLDIDTPTKTVVEYELNIDAGTLGDPRIVVDVRDGDVFPDGMIMTPDQQSVIVAFYNPNDAPHGEARQYRLADGELETVWTTPGSPRVTCPQLVKIDGRIELILTTAVEHMSAEQQAKHPNAGAIFHAETSFSDVSPQPRFRLGSARN